MILYVSRKELADTNSVCGYAEAIPNEIATELLTEISEARKK